MIALPTKPERNGASHSAKMLASPDSRVRPFVDDYDPSEMHPLCKSGRTLAEDIRPFAPGPARALDHQTAEVERFARLANEAREGAVVEFQGIVARQRDQAKAIQERQPALLREREELSKSRAAMRQAFSRAAAALGLVFAPDTVTEQDVLRALTPPAISTVPSPVPVPGSPGPFQRLWEAVTLEAAVIVCGIPLGLAVATLTGLVSPHHLEALTNGTDVDWVRLTLSWAIGIGIHRLFLREAMEIGKGRVADKFQGYRKDLPEAVKYRGDIRLGLFKLTLFWLLLAGLEGVGLHFLSQEIAVMGVGGNTPWFVFLVIGGVISGGIMGVGYFKAFIDGCRELAKGWSPQPVETVSVLPTDREIGLRQNLLAAACELMDLNARLAEVEARLRADAAALAEKPRVSPDTLQRIARAEAEEERAVKRLRELLEYIARRMGRLGPNIEMDDVDVPAKIVLFPFQKVWLGIRGRRGDSWPDP